jgi:hypothetical protein
MNQAKTTLEEFIDQLNKFQNSSGAQFTNELKEINSIISELSLLNINIKEDLNLDLQQFLSSLNAKQLDYFSSIIDLNKSLRLLLKGQDLMINIMQRNFQNINVLTNKANIANELYHDLNLEVESHQRILKKKKEDISSRAQFAAKKKHEPKKVAKERIIEIWKSGKYSNRDLCAEQECAALGLSFSTARKALRNK